MEVQVRVRGSNSPDAVRSYVAQRVRLALGRFVDRLGRVRVGVFETRDSRDGIVESSCRIIAMVPSAERIDVREIDMDLYAAIDRATERISRTCSRVLDAHRLGSRLGAGSQGDAGS